MTQQTLEPITRPFRATVSPPPSKSLTNRALVLAALTDGQSTVRNVLIADDTRVMLDGIKALGFEVICQDGGNSVQISGCRGRIPSTSAELFCGNSGTTIRFLTAMCALGQGAFKLDGIPRMRQRPIGELAKMLRDLGTRCEFPEKDGFPPIVVHGDGLPGGIIRFGSAQSSQFLSAILMISPFARHEVSVDLIDRQTSWPYVEMTMRLMDIFGLTAELIRDPKTSEPKRIVIPQGDYAATDYTVEPDASNASYFLAAAAINPGSSVKILGLGKQSLQGDVGFAQVLKRMGATMKVENDSITVEGGKDLAGIEINLADMPDTAQTLAVAALFADGPTVIHGLGTLRVKETDRLAALKNELLKFGAEVKIEEDSLHIQPPGKLLPAAIDTYDDHRMAMSFAVAGTRSPGVVINDPQCVNKTYPNFFQDLRKAVSAVAMLLGIFIATLAHAQDATTKPSVGLGNMPSIQFDIKKKQVRVACEAVNPQMPLEFFCVVRGGQEHETVLRTDAKPSDIHFCLLALGLAPGEPAHMDAATKEWYPPYGPPLKISCELDIDGKDTVVPANRLMRGVKDKKEMPPLNFVFDGSRVLPDGRYAADIAGYVVSIVNFDLTMIDVPELASNANETLEWEYNPDIVPKKGTPVTMIIEPAGEKTASRPSGIPSDKFNPGPGLGGGGG